MLPIMHTRETIQKEVIIMFDFNSILSNAAAYTSAKTASTAEVDAKYNELIGIQDQRNKQYDKMLDALQKGANALSETEAKDLLSENGFVKVELNKTYKANLKNQVKQALDAEKNAALKESLSEMKELAKEFAEIENQYTPKSSIDKYIELKIAQEFPTTAPAYQPTYAPAPQPAINPILAEKSRLNREKEARITELRNNKKKGYISALEMAQGIAELNSEYNAKINNL